MTGDEHELNGRMAGTASCVRGAAIAVLVAIATGAGSSVASSAPSAIAPVPSHARGAAAEVAPPGVPADDVALRERTGTQRTLAEVIELLGPMQSPAGPAVAPLDPASSEAAEVRRRAARGAEAMAQGKPLKAVPDFEAAVAIDPADPELLRHLAQSYSQVGNEAKALGVYERLLLVRPDDPQALVATGIATAAKRSYEEAVRRIAAGLASSAKGADTGRALPLASRILAERGLAGILRELEFDVASLEASTQALASLDALDASLADTAEKERPDTTRLRAEILLGRADAATRLGRNDEALADLRSIAGIRGADPDIVLPRELLLLERTGKSADADDRLAKSLIHEGAPPTLREVQLAEWLVARSAERPGLRLAARSVIESQPTNILAARLVGTVDPPVAARAYRAIIAQRPTSEEAWRGLLRGVAPRDAVTIAAALVEGTATTPEAGMTALRAALGTGVTERALREALRAQPPSPAAAAALARLAMLGRDGGHAWRGLGEARAKWPADVGMALAQIEAAAALEEPILLDALERGAAGSAAGLPDDPRMAPALALARRAAGDLKGALVRLEALAASTPPRGGAAVDAAIASMLADEAMSRRPDDPSRREIADKARAAAERALESDPEEADAALVLLRLRDPRSGALGDAEAWSALRTRLRASSLQWLDERVAAEEDLARGRNEQGLARLRELAESRPFDGDLVGLATSTLARAQRAEDALKWLDEAIREQPGLVSLRDARLSARVAAGQGEAALAEIEKTLVDDPDDALASWHLEALLRALGRQDEAIARNRERIRERPIGPRRALELANLEQRAERPAEALSAIESIGKDAPLSNAQRLAAVEIVSRLPSSIPGRNDLLVSLCEAGLDSDDAERVVYAAAAATGVMDEAKDGTRSEQSEALARVRALADKAAKDAGSDVSQIIRWRDSAQLLVDADAPAAAAEILRARLMAGSALAPAAQRVLQSGAFACDAAAKGRADAAMELLNELRGRGERPFSWAREGAEGRDAALLALSALFMVVDDREGSERILETLLAEFPTHAMAKNNLAWSRVERGVVDERTAALAEEAMKASPNESAILDTLGWIRYLQGQIEDDASSGRVGAVTLLRKAVDAAAPDPSLEVLDHYGDALWRSGNREGAMNAWRESGRVLRERFDRTKALPQIANYLLSETGLRIVDPGRFYEVHFEHAASRAARKLEEAQAGKDPSIAALVAASQAGPANAPGAAPVPPLR